MKRRNPRCHQCGEDLVARVAPPHLRKLRYEGSPYDVLIEGLPEWHCETCDLSVTDEDGDPVLQAALRKHIGLLSPEQIRAGLKSLNLSQDAFADRIGCAAESISRWLNGAVLQSRTYDRLMRIYFHCPEVRGLLDGLGAGVHFGDHVIHAEAAGAAHCELVARDT